MLGSVFTGIMATFLVVCPGIALAGNASIGRIDSFIGQAGVFFFTTTGQRNSAPACATQSNRWAIDITTASGQSVQATVLTAQALGYQVTVAGTGSCTVWGDSETVIYVVVPNL